MVDDRVAKMAEKRRDLRFTLKEREEIIISGVAMGLPQKEIWVRAGFTGRYDSSRFNAILNKPHIQDEIAKRQGEVAKRNELTEDEIIKKLRDAYNKAESLGQPAAMVSAATALAKVAGILDKAPGQNLGDSPKPPADPALRKQHDARMARIAGLGVKDLKDSEPKGSA